MQNTLSKPLPTTARLSLHLRDQAGLGTSVSTHDHLRFQLDHALARDAVHTSLDLAALQRGLTERGLHPITLRSAATDRKTYLRRPDMGRTLHPDSISALSEIAAKNSVISAGGPAQDSFISTEAKRSGETPVFRTTTEPHPTTLFLLADGLSALALERHALPLLDAIRSLFPLPSSLFPLVQNARVAIADPIGHILGAQTTVLLIGERPGLSSPDSLGCYITWNPRPGRTDAERNCISNIRGAEGLSYAEAAHRIAHYLHEAHRLHTTGTTLKDPATSTPLL